jgi:hypothetical protein
VEIFGLIIAAGFGLFASPIYCLIVVKLVKRSVYLRAIAFWGAISILALSTVHLLLISFSGIIAAREAIGTAFEIIQGFLVLTAAPALGAALLLGKRNLWWPVTAGLCWCVGFSALLFGIHVSETLYGVDGQGPPAFRESTGTLNRHSYDPDEKWQFRRVG